MKMYVSSNYEGADDDDSSNEAGVVNNKKRTWKIYKTSSLAKIWVSLSPCNGCNI